jgi:tRNA(Ile)-lysidine synthase
MPGLIEAVASTLRRHALLAGGERVLIAVSGGADSVALLHVLHALAPSHHLDLHVLHVDHRLRADSARDAHFVLDLTARLGVRADVATVTVARGDSLEAQARAARYAALEACADRIGADRIAVGHTRDDQAETVLMRFLQGAGPRGLAGIPARRGRVIRPLLEVGRREIVGALEAAGLGWLEDPSNLDPKFLRNRVRHEVLPFLGSYQGNIVDVLNATAMQMRALVSALDAGAEAELARLATWGDGEIVLPRPALSDLPRDLAANILRLGAVRLGGRAPLRAWAHRGLARALGEPPARRPFRLGGVTVEVSGTLIRIATHRRAPLDTREVVVPGPTPLPEIDARLEARVVSAAGYRLPTDPDRVAFDADRLSGPLVVRRRRGGDRVMAFGGGERRVKSLLIDAKVPRWKRDGVPIVEAGGEVIWIAGIRRGAAAPVTAATQHVLELALVVTRADEVRRPLE